MNIYLIKTDENGRIQQRVVTSKVEATLFGGDFFEVPPWPETATHYRNGRYATRPESPGDAFTFDEKLFAWVWCEAAALRAIRLHRDRLLQACDWTQLPDVPAATREAWQAYRQALRDITAQPDISALVWPKPPQ